MNCEYCKNEHDGKYGSGRFCNSICAHSRILTKEIKEKVGNTLKRFYSNYENRSIHSNTMKDYYKNNPEKLPTKKGSKLSKEHKQNIAIGHLGTTLSAETKKLLSHINKERCKNVEERKRLRDIGRKGGFGKKGYTNKGTFFQSNLEKSCFEFLEKEGVIFEPHKNVSNSSKVSDIYLPQIDLWIELDGMNREKIKRYEYFKKDYEYWLSKLETYNVQGLNNKIFTSFQDFKDFIINSSIV